MGVQHTHWLSFVVLLAASCGTSSSRAAPAPAPVPAQAAEPAATEPSALIPVPDASPGPSSKAPEVEEQLHLVRVDMPAGMTTEQCDELCMVEAVCSEHVTGEDYSGGGRCVGSCEDDGDDFMSGTEDCVREATTCAAALECFD